MLTSLCVAEDKLAIVTEKTDSAIPEQIKPAMTPEGVSLIPTPSTTPALPTAEAPPPVPEAIPLPPLSELYLATEAGDAAKVKELLKDSTVPAGLESNGDTALCVALRNWHPVIAEFLLEKQADVNSPGLNEEYPVQLASLRRHPTLMEKLLTAGANPNHAFTFPLSTELLAKLDDGYVKRQLTRESRMTPLMVSAARGDVESVALLIKHGAKTNTFTQPGAKYPINFAAANDYLFVMRLLLGRDPESEPARLVTVNLTTQTAQVSVNGEVQLTTKISSGRKGYETPEGRYVITNKYTNWKSTIYKVNMPYFMRFNCGEIGLHSGHVTGRPASHGCVRLPFAIAKKIFGIVKVGDEVIVQN